MNKIDVYKKAAVDLGIPAVEIEKAYKSFWEYIKQTIAVIPIKDSSEEELREMRTSFNIPELGKLYCKKGRIKYVEDKKGKADS